MLVNKKADMTPYDMKRRPSGQPPVLLPAIWGIAWVMTRQFRLKIDRSQLKGIKPPYLIIATHQGFSDYYIAPLATFPHRAMYVSDMEGFAAFGNTVYRWIGCIPKRRFVPDISVIKNIQYGLSKGQSVWVYPESRHSNVGTTAYIPSNMGRLAKILKVPVVILHANGSYLANPFWDEEHTRKVPIKAEMKCICDAAELAKIDPSELQKRIEKELQYDEYRYQQENGIIIADAKRAEGLHLALYKCRNCGASGTMKSSGSVLSCNACNSSWNLSEDGWLIPSDSATGSSGKCVNEASVRIHIPDWYEWQRSETIQSIGELPVEFDVRVEALPNEFGFVDMGNGHLTFNDKEFVLRIGENELHFPHHNRESVQTEYNYRNKGRCIVLSTRDCCYYIYSDDVRFQPTWIQFAGEYLYQKAVADGQG